MASYPPLVDRPIKNTIVLFDVDDTITVPRQVRFSYLPLHFSFPQEEEEEEEEEGEATCY